MVLVALAAEGASEDRRGLRSTWLHDRLTNDSLTISQEI